MITVWVLGDQLDRLLKAVRSCLTRCETALMLTVAKLELDGQPPDEMRLVEPS